MQTNSAQSLAERLAEKQKQDREQIEALTRSELERHAENLRTLSAAAVASTKTVTDEATQALKVIFNGRPGPQGQTVGGMLPALQAQEKALQEAIEKQTKHLLWLMKWPVLVTAALCLLICAGTWGYWMLASPYQTMRMNNGPYLVMKGGDWTMCNIAPAKAPPINRPCQPAGND